MGGKWEHKHNKITFNCKKIICFDVFSQNKINLIETFSSFLDLELKMIQLAPSLCENFLVLRETDNISGKKHFKSQLFKNFGISEIKKFKVTLFSKNFNKFGNFGDFFNRNFTWNWLIKISFCTKFNFTLFMDAPKIKNFH